MSTHTNTSPSEATTAVISMARSASTAAKLTAFGGTLALTRLRQRKVLPLVARLTATSGQQLAQVTASVPRQLVNQ